LYTGLWAAKTITFEEGTEKYIEAHRAGWKHPNHLKQSEPWLST
jgi:hypothetical protein